MVQQTLVKPHPRQVIPLCCSFFLVLEFLVKMSWEEHCLLRLVVRCVDNKVIFYFKLFVISMSIFQVHVYFYFYFWSWSIHVFFFFCSPLILRMIMSRSPLFPPSFYLFSTLSRKTLLRQSVFSLNWGLGIVLALLGRVREAVKKK